MADSKTSCSKCGGNIAFPKELGGQQISCPHCGETTYLPFSKSAIPWVVTGILSLITLCLALVLAFEHSKPSKVTAESPSNVERSSLNNDSSANTDVKTQNPKDKEAIGKLCEEFYNDLNNGDESAVFSLVAASCQKLLTPKDMSMPIDRVKYRFIAVESVKYETSTLGLSAIAKVKRTVMDGAEMRDGWRSYKFIKEPNGWRFFRDEEIMNKVVGDFRGSLTKEIVANIQLLRDGDPFDNWSNDDKTDFERIFKLTEGQPGVFPWGVEFNVISNVLDGYSLSLAYSIRNKSSSTWSEPYLDFDLKLKGEVISSRNAQLPDLSPGSEVVRKISFLLMDQPQETTTYLLSASYPLGISPKYLSVVENLPVEVKVKKATEMVKLEITSTQFESTLSDSFENMLSARLNFRVRNVSAAPVKDLEVKCVWFSLNGEQVDQSTEYVVGFNDVPLGIGQSKSGFIRCGKGYRNLRVPVKVDVYLESDGKRDLVFKGISVR